MRRALRKVKLSHLNETFSYCEEILLLFYQVGDRNSFESLSEISEQVVVGNLHQPEKKKAQNTLTELVLIPCDQNN